MQQAWERSAYEVLVGKYEEKKKQLGGPSVDGKMILKWI
jgi:hypothetical protein